jgi:hypothetical protein
MQQVGAGAVQALLVEMVRLVGQQVMVVMV